jgi:hypothetical protein
MSSPKKSRWKKGRGKLGVLDPLLGSWEAQTETPMGPTACVRTFARALNDAYVILDASWDFSGKVYREHAIYGPGDDGQVVFWSFTSDGKRSQGTIADATDIHPAAIGFEAQMPAGLARLVYWPDGDNTNGIQWAVESKSKKGWKRFTLHHYRPR